MRILVAEDDPAVGDAFEEVLRAAYNTVYRSTSVEDTAGWLGDGEAEVVLLDVQLQDGTATELSRVTEQLELLETAESAERLRALDEVKTALLAAVRHDLRTPPGLMKAAVTAALEPDLHQSEM